MSGLRCQPRHTPPRNKADPYALFSSAEIRETLNNLILKSPQEWHTQVALPFVKIVGTTVECKFATFFTRHNPTTLVPNAHDLCCSCQQGTRFASTFVCSSAFRYVLLPERLAFNSILL